MKVIGFQLFIFIIIAITFPKYVFGQSLSSKYAVNWNGYKDINQPFKGLSDAGFPRFLPEKFGKLPLVYLKIPVSHNNISVKIIPLSFDEFHVSDKEDINKIQENIVLNYSVSTEKKQSWLNVTFLPFVKQNNTISKVLDYEVVINEKTPLARISGSGTAASFVSNSVLSSGNWYKIAVKEEGIYKISASFLKNIGINIDQVNPKTIKIFGNGGAMLPQSNAAPRKDDLQENAIKVIGEQDGRFDNEDYILFYANGNINWQLNTEGSAFTRTKNIYSDSSYYFLNVDGVVGKRIVHSATNNLTPNVTVNYYDDFQSHEHDLYTSITASLKSGREWYGEDFEFNATRNFEFNFNDLEPNSIGTISTNMAIRSNVNSFAQVKINNQVISSLFANSLPLNFETEYAKSTVANSSFQPVQNAALSITYNKPNSNSNAWLNFIELNLRKSLNGNSNWLRFRDTKSVAPGNVSKFVFTGNLTGKEIWDVTDFLNPNSVDITGNECISRTENLKEFVLFSVTSLKEPIFIKKLANQNLHALPNAEMVIISPPEFISEARRLADFRKAEQNINTHMVTPEQVYNEFSSGKKDAAAIRNFMKMFYDRAGLNLALAPKYLLLMGSGSFDNRSLKFKNKDFIVTYQSNNSLSPTESYTSDDFFALLDNNEGDFPEDYITSPGMLDIAVGRLPVTSAKEAKDVVDKLILYADKSQFGDWRNKIAIVADDEDGNTHLDQAEANAALIHQKNTNINLDKIYFDAYTQESTASGMRYPEVKDLINQKINTGILLMNYTGHGGEGGWAEEQVLQVEDINKWNNTFLPVIFTATCSFGRWDDPEIVSAGELTLKKEKSGTIGLFTTTRIVYASYNFDLNQSFLRSLLDPSFTLRKPSFGEVFRMAKNNNIGGLNINSRNFTLLGDPSALFAFPENKILTTSVNNQTVSTTDTLKALQKINIKGSVRDANGNLLPNFNGIIYPVIFDKPAVVTTRGQDPGITGSLPQDFKLQSNIIYKGKASVKDGNFSFDFLVPKDINLEYGKGKISYYADNNLIDANGAYSDVTIGGLDATAQNDKLGPEIELYLNDNKFVSGGITHTSPFLLADIKDESGINTTGLGIGHDIVATLTFKEKSTSIILNQWYESKLDSYQEGSVKYNLTDLEPGLYSLKLKVWDVFNNSSEKIIDFEVKSSENLELAHVLNYPNPFTSKTSFQFEHNHQNEDLDVQVNIYTIAGKLIKTINQAIPNAQSRVDNIFWDGKDDFGDKLARGIYIYQLKVRSYVNGEVVKKIQKLVIL